MITGEKLSLSKIGQISVPVHDIQRATAFYRDQLGMSHLFTATNLSFFDCGGIRLMLSVPERPEFDRPATILYYLVDDISKTSGELSARGVRFEQGPHLLARMPDHELWMAFFRDAEDNLLALMSEGR